MTDVRKILLDSALALGVFVVAGVALVGEQYGAGIFASGLLTLGNLALLAWISTRLTRAVEQGRGGGAAIALLFFKFLLVVAAYGGLLMLFPATSVAVGLCSGVVGMSARSVVDVLRLSDGPRGPDQEF